VVISLAQDKESPPARTDVLTTMLRHQLSHTPTHSKARSLIIIVVTANYSEMFDISLRFRNYKASVCLKQRLSLILRHGVCLIENFRPKAVFCLKSRKHRTIWHCLFTKYLHRQWRIVVFFWHQQNTRCRPTGRYKYPHFIESGQAQNTDMRTGSKYPHRWTLFHMS